jgi:hypothetical protein
MDQQKRDDKNANRRAKNAAMTDEMRAEKLKRDRVYRADYDKIYREKHGDKRRAWEKQWRAKRKEQIKTNYQKWRSKAPNYLIDKRKNNASFKTAKNVRCRLESCMRSRGFKKTEKTKELLGCSWEECVAHLEDNPRGLKILDKDNHIDHIRPLASFPDLSSTWEQRTANHYLNLQLLPAKENLTKKDSFDYDTWAVSESGKALLALNREWRMETFFS